MTTYSLKCKSCQGVLELTEKKNVLYCPYCGSKELIEVSDSVLKTTIIADAFTQSVRDRLNNRLQMKQKSLENEREKRESENQRSAQSSMVTIVCMIGLIMILYFVLFKL